MILRSSVRHVFAAAALMVTFQASARPSQESLSVLTDSFAEAALVGMKLSFAKNFDQGKVTRAQYQCVEQLNASDMRKTVYEVLAQALNDDELQDAQEFLAVAWVSSTPDMASSKSILSVA